MLQRSWFPSVIEAKYEPAYPAIEEFLMTIGRRYLVRPVYLELAKTPEGLEFARQPAAFLQSGRSRFGSHHRRSRGHCGR